LAVGKVKRGEENQRGTVGQVGKRSSARKDTYAQKRLRYKKNYPIIRKEIERELKERGAATERLGSFRGKKKSKFVGKKKTGSAPSGILPEVRD